MREMDKVYQEFAMSKFCTKEDREEAMINTIKSLRAELLAIHEIACLGWSNWTPIKPEDPSTLRGVKILVETINSMEGELDNAKRRYEDFEQVTLSQMEAFAKLVASKQAQIDQLMLEYCPEDMSAEQVEEWGKHQVPVEDEKK